MKYIHRIGVEMEGAWSRPLFEISRDGSVNMNHLLCHCECHGDYFCDCCAEKCDHDKRLAIGEIQSMPMETLNHVQEFINTTYPTHINETCGLHVHVSMSNENYALLMNRKYFNQFTRCMVNFKNTLPYRDQEAFAPRLAGKNKYTKNTFMPLKQFRQQRKYHPYRYTSLNYCYRIHNTVETRVFPMFSTPELCYNAVKAFINSVESYLDGAHKTKEIYTLEVEDTLCA